MRTVVLVPRREDGGRRDELWEEVYWHITELHPTWPIFEGHHGGEKFSIAAARNDAARQATENYPDWDVAVFWDSDTTARPDAVRSAVDRASLGTRLWFAGDVYMNMDKVSTDHVLGGGAYWPRPDGSLPKNGSLAANNSIYGEPSSGILAVSRPLWDAIGGYLESLEGWGYEDLVFLTSACIFGDGVSWVPNEIIFHLWHEKSRITDDTRKNYAIWQELDAIARMENKIEVATAYLKQLGHIWPTAASS